MYCCQCINFDLAVQELDSIIQEATDSYLINKRKAKPWFDESCYEARKRTLCALHKAKSTPSATTLQAYAANRRSYKTLLKQKKNEYYEDIGRKQIEEAKSSPYTALKPRIPKFPRDIPIETWVTHFKQVLSSKDTQPNRGHNKSITLENHELFTITEVQDVIKNLKNRKASGPDDLFNEHIKTAAPALVETWTLIFNECLQQGRIPDRWRDATL